ncbi:MAG: shikimate dehydrogenase [Chitinophagaceae bacterium]|jgi:shikimate dehydrogenase|nr:shikimate dehydrogenase [Chitinophagaceae bacterium]
MRLFGLIGYPLSHSFSKEYFTKKFEIEKLTNCRYENFPIASIAEIKNILHNKLELVGLNVTIPYKQQVISYLHHASPVVQVIGACNCIHLKNGQLHGHNTDVIGFKKSLEKYLQPHHTKALILGSGGVSKAVEYVLSKLNIRFQVVSRNPDNTQLNYRLLSKSIIQEHLLLINTTPLGTFPNTEDAPEIPYELLTPNHYLFDVVYNPPSTKFLKMGQEKGAKTQNGLEMLQIQADESWKIWNEID